MSANNIERMFERISAYSEWIFDLDNTLYCQLEYDSVVFQALEQRLRKDHGYSVSGLGNRLIERKRALGPWYPHLFDEVLTDFGLTHGDIQTAILFYRDHRPNFVSGHNIVRQLSERKEARPIFVITNGHLELQKHKVNCLGLDSLVTEVIYCDKSYPERLKPSAWAWHVLSSRYPFNRPIFVGDNDAVDGAFARNAGIEFYQFEYCYENC